MGETTATSGVAAVGRARQIQLPTGHVPDGRLWKTQILREDHGPVTHPSWKLVSSLESAESISYSPAHSSFGSGPLLLTF